MGCGGCLRAAGRTAFGAALAAARGAPLPSAARGSAANVPAPPAGSSRVAGGAPGDATGGAPYICVVSYSDKGAGGRWLRREILNATVQQWMYLGFQVHVVADVGDLRLPEGAILAQRSSDNFPGAHNGTGFILPWHAIGLLRGLPGPATLLVAYAEDDVFMPAETFHHWATRRDEVSRQGLRLGFHRVEADGKHLTDTYRQWDGEPFARGRADISGECLVELVNPYSGLFLMTGLEFVRDYLPSPWSSWAAAVGVSPWHSAETAASGLTWFVPPGERFARRVVTSPDRGHVLHLWPSKSRAYPYALERGKYTRDDLRQICSAERTEL